MVRTWIVVARSEVVTIIEYGDQVRQLVELANGSASPAEITHRVVTWLERESASSPPDHLVLLAQPSYLGRLRAGLSPLLSDRVRVASNAISSASDKKRLRALLEPIVSRP